MPAYMICETCLRLWIEYGAATAKMRAITRNQSLMLEATEVRKAVEQLIRLHEAVAHASGHDASPIRQTDKARAVA